VTLILVVLDGVVNVPGEVNTVILENPPAAAAAHAGKPPTTVNT
jgi:hypothetical protein